MMLFVFALRGNFPHAGNRLHKAQDRNLVVADANDQTTILIAMGARKRNGAFAVDQPRDVGSFRGIEPRHLAMQGHASGSARRRKKKRPPLGVAVEWWRRRDSCSIPFGTGWTMPSSCYQDAGRVIRLRGS